MADGFTVYAGSTVQGGRDLTAPIAELREAFPQALVVPGGREVTIYPRTADEEQRIGAWLRARELIA
jgi:hypothetical protein